MSGDPVLITGVGRRAGLHLARAFLQRGVAVIGTYRTRYAEVDELERLGAESNEAGPCSARLEVISRATPAVMDAGVQAAIEKAAGDVVTGDCNLANTAIAERTEGEYGGYLRGLLESWFERTRIRPRIVAEVGEDRASQVAEDVAAAVSAEPSSDHSLLRRP